MIVLQEKHLVKYGKISRCIVIDSAFIKHGYLNPKKTYTVKIYDPDSEVVETV